jgi:hypothetical protein
MVKNVRDHAIHVPENFNRRNAQGVIPRLGEDPIAMSITLRPIPVAVTFAVDLDQ